MFFKFLTDLIIKNKMKNIRKILITLLTLQITHQFKLIAKNLAEKQEFLKARASHNLFHSKNSKFTKKIADRNLLSNDEQKNQDQNKRFQEEYFNQVRKYKENYGFLNHLNDIENDDLKLIHQRYIKLKASIRHTKDVINENFDETFNNFIIPNRGHY